MAFNWNKFPWTNLHDLNLDWIIQKVRELERKVLDATQIAVQYTDDKISDLLTGAGDLTINKSGDVSITGNSVQLTGGTVVSDGAEQLTMHNPNSKTSMTANYNNGVLTLSNNQDLANGVAVYPLNTPADGGGDNSDFAANVGYVKDAVNAVDSKLNIEITNRTSGDNTLQSTIDNVIMPLLTARGVRDFHMTGTVGPDRELTSVSFDSENPKTELDELLTASTKVRLVVEIPDETRYFNMCYKTAAEYGFSGIYQAGDGVATPERLIYNGTTFEIQ